MRQEFIPGGATPIAINSSSTRDNSLIVEAATLGIAYSSGLCWTSTCVVASFRVAYLAKPYWSAISDLRTDTCGAAAFILTTVCLAVSEYLRLRRRYGVGAQLAVGATRGVLAALAVAKTAAVVSTGLFAYLSINTVTHPVTLGMPATHFSPWPTEGSLRVLALATAMLAVGGLRYLSVRAGIGQRQVRTRI